LTAVSSLAATAHAHTADFAFYGWTDRITREYLTGKSLLARRAFCCWCYWYWRFALGTGIVATGRKLPGLVARSEKPLRNRLAGCVPWGLSASLLSTILAWFSSGCTASSGLWRA